MTYHSENLAKIELRIRTDPGFDFQSTVYSHGWYSLPPFSVNDDRSELIRILRLPGGTTVRCAIAAAGRHLRVTCHSSAPMSAQDRRRIRSCVAAMLRLEEDLTGFHRTTRRYSRYRWIARHGGGRLLRAPTVFEDMIKMICTTNCTWSLTTIMVRNLVDSLGDGPRKEWRSFPDAEAVAGTSERFLRNEVKTGYRSPYLLALADRVASGKLNPERWRDTRQPGSEVLKELLAIKGIGPYAAQNMLRLLGHYDHLALDSWVRSRYYSLYHGGRIVKDRTIEARYARYGQWKGLIFWMEMTKGWYDEKFAQNLPESESL